MPPNTSEAPGSIVGLTAQEADARLEQFGPNEPAATKHHFFLSDLLHQFTNPLVLILLIAAVASAFLGEKVDASSDQDRTGAEAANGAGGVGKADWRGPRPPYYLL